MSIESREIEANGLRFHCREAGRGGEPVVLLHGFPETSRIWAGVMKRLAAEGYHCLAPDQRGYSPAARPAHVDRYSYEDLPAVAGAAVAGICLLSSQADGRWGAGGDSPGNGGDNVGNDERPGSHEHHRPWHRGLRHGVDLAGEEDPELASEGGTDRHADDDPSDGGDRRLPSDCGSQLSLGESERLQQSKVSFAATHGRDECEAEGHEGAEG